MATQRDLVVDAPTGPLHAVLQFPDGDGPHPGLVLVDGSGGGGRDDRGGWPTWLGWGGVAVLRHDKPGTGDSAGDWLPHGATRTPPCRARLAGAG